MANITFFDALKNKLRWGQSGNSNDFTDQQYKAGWAYIGDTPPSVAQFNELFQLNDEKDNWLYGQIETVATQYGITLSGTDLTALQQILGQFLTKRDRKSTRLNSSHVSISYAVFCLKKITSFK